MFVKVAEGKILRLHFEQTNSMEQSFSEDDSRLTGQEIPRLLWNP
jgi:hypothetical protein